MSKRSIIVIEDIDWKTCKEETTQRDLDTDGRVTWILGR
jgi:hypothetical protein